MAITDLGYIQESATLQVLWNLRIPGGNTHSFWWYWIGSKPSNMFSINHDTDVINPPVRGPYGRPYQVCLHPTDNLLYLGAYSGGSLESPVCCYDVVTGAYTHLHAGPEYSVADGGPQYDGTRNNCVTYSDEANKRVFYVGTIRAGMWAYDPVTTIFTDFGIIDDPGVHRSRYAHSIQVNATHAYIAIIDSSPAEQYLAKVDIATGALTATYWKGEGNKAVQISRCTDQTKIYVYVKTSADVEHWYEVSDLVNPIATPSDYFPAFYRGAVAYTGYSYDYSQAFPASAVDLSFPVYYKRTGDTDYRTGTASVLDTTPYALNVAAPGIDGKLLCAAENYGPVTRFDPATARGTQLGISSTSSIYGVGVDYQRGLEFLGGYSQISKKYNPGAAWVPGTNPLTIILARQSTDPINPVAGARYHRCIHKMIDKNIWWGTSYVRGTPAYDSQVIWFNPDDDTTGDVDWTLTQHCVMENCTPNKSLTKYLYSAYDYDSPYNGFISVINVRKKAVIKYITPSGGIGQGRLVSVESSKATTNRFVGVVSLRYADITVTGGSAPVAGEIITGGAVTARLHIAPAAWVGVVRCYFLAPSAAFAAGAVTFSGGGTGTIAGAMTKCYTTYCVDIKTGALIWGPTAYVTASTNFGEHSSFDINLGPTFAHDYVWFYSGNNIVKVDPADGTQTTAQAVDYPGQMAWVGDTLYHWDKTSKKIYSITGLV